MLTIAFALAVATPAAAPAPDSTTIVVTGVRIADLRAAVEACAAGACTPRQDIVASIRYAEALFKSGDYTQSRKVLNGSIGRTKGAGAQEPIALSQLYLAKANVAAHFGEQEDIRSATYASARVLHENLPAGSVDTLLADLRVADWQLRSGVPRDALTSYADVAAKARAGDHPEIAASADLHRAWLLHLFKREADAKQLLDGLAALPGDDMRSIRLAARVVLARIARDGGDRKAAEALVAALASEPQGAKPVLVYQPPYPAPADAVPRDPLQTTVDASTRPSDYNSLQWADIGFWIRADGGVDGVEILRGSTESGWAKPLVKMIEQRRYTPFKDPSGGQGQYHVERFTMTSDFATPVGSLVRRRVGQQRFEQIDLTVTPPAPPTGS